MPTFLQRPPRPDAAKLRYGGREGAAVHEPPRRANAQCPDIRRGAGCARGGSAPDQPRAPRAFRALRSGRPSRRVSARTPDRSPAGCGRRSSLGPPAKRLRRRNGPRNRPCRHGARFRAIARNGGGPRHADNPPFLSFACRRCRDTNRRNRRQGIKLSGRYLEDFAVGQTVASGRLLISVDANQRDAVTPNQSFQTFTTPIGVWTPSQFTLGLLSVS